MACELPTLVPISFDCTKLPIGGVTSIKYAALQDVAGYIEDDGVLSQITIDPANIHDVEFNTKDGITNFTDSKTIAANGTQSAAPTVVVSLPAMNVDTRDQLMKLVNPNFRFVIFVATAARTYHAVGLEFGCTLSEITATSGTARSDLNGYQITFTGDENELAFNANDVWSTIEP